MGYDHPGKCRPEYSPGAYVRNIARVGSSYWKQSTRLEVLRRPQITRKILLPVL